MQNQLNFMLGTGAGQHGKVNIDAEISEFQIKNNLLVPKDMWEYFSLLKTTKKYNERLYQFYPLVEFKSIDQELKYFSGTPDYSRIAQSLESYKNCFVFADYMFHMFTYAIRLSENLTENNDVYVICGERYKIIANTFTDFINLYSTESIELQFSN